MREMQENVVMGRAWIKALREWHALMFKPIPMHGIESAQTKRMNTKAVGAVGWLINNIEPTDLLAVIK